MTKSDSPRRPQGYSAKVEAIRAAEQARLAAMPPPVTGRDVAAVLERYPLLSWAGNGYGPSWQGHNAMLKEFRGRLLADSSVTSVGRMRDWITANLVPRKAFINGPSSYRLKHIAERAGAGYSSNGEFLVAAILAGLPVDMASGDLNPSIGVTQRSVRDADPRLRGGAR